MRIEVVFELGDRVVADFDETASHIFADKLAPFLL
jgi:hypothetical protein